MVPCFDVREEGVSYIKRGVIELERGWPHPDNDVRAGDELPVSSGYDKAVG